MSPSFMSVRPIESPVKSPPPPQDTIILPFWLVACVSVQSIDYTNEITTLNCFTKWQFQEECFFNRDCLKKLVCHSAEIDASDYDDLLAGKRKSGFMVEDHAGSKCFPVNPDAMIQNDVGSSQDTSGPNWLQLNPTTRTVYCQIAFTVTLHTPFQMKQFPFDRHIIPLCLGTRAWKEKVDGVKQSYKWSLLRKRPEWAEGTYEEDNTIISENLAWVDRDNEMVHLRPIVHITEKGKPVLCLRIERDPTYFVTTTCVPIGAIVLLCLSSFFLEFNNAGSRLEAVLISALTVSAYKAAIEGKLPVKSYLTFADYYLLFCFMFFFALALKVVMAFQGLGNGVGFFWYDEDADKEDDDEGATDKEDKTSKTNALFQNLDDATSWGLLVFWISIHIVFLVDARVRHRGPKVQGQAQIGMLDKYLRPSWDQKVSLIRKPFDVVLGTN